MIAAIVGIAPAFLNSARPLAPTQPQLSPQFADNKAHSRGQLGTCMQMRDNRPGQGFLNNNQNNNSRNFWDDYLV